MRSVSACIVAGWIGALAWACASPHGGFTDDGTGDPSDAGQPDASEVVDKGEAGGGEDSGASADTGSATDSAQAKDTAPSVDAAGCAKVGASKTCGLAPQCGCPSDQTCDLNTSGDTLCVGPAGINGEGNLCSNTGSCAVGLSCVWGNACHRFCSAPGAPCGNDAGLCVQLKDNADAAIPNLMLCEVRCQLQDPNACGGGGVGCFPSSAGTGGSDCARAGNGAVDAPCTYLDDCQAGLGCIGVQGSQAQCRKWCRVGQNGDCGGQTCGALNPPLVINGVTYGSCP
jgi:hypothetical protein